MFCFTTNAFCLFSHLCVCSDLGVFSPRDPVLHVVYQTLLTFLSVGILVDFRILIWASGCCLLFEPFLSSACSFISFGPVFGYCYDFIPSCLHLVRCSKLFLKQNSGIGTHRFTAFPLRGGNKSVCQGGCLHCCCQHC